MLCRIFYTNKYSAIERSLPKVGTTYNINSLEDLVNFASVIEREVIIDKNNLPNWLDHLQYMWQDKWLEHIVDDYENVVEEEYLVEYPTKDWLTCQWIEVYNGYRE